MFELAPVSSALVALFIATALSGCGGGDSAPSSKVGTGSQTTTDAVAAAAAAAATKAVEDAVAAAATKAVEDAATAEAAKVALAKAASDAKAAAAAKPVAAAAPEVFRMPNLVGENLQLAQDKLQVLGSYVMDQEDAAGLNRIQANDSNWQVCAQKPAPGKTVPVETVVLLTSVKLAEQCP